MRGRLSEHRRSIVAAVLALTTIGGAYVLAHGIEFPSLVHASTTDALLQTIATKDSDHDGLPDWEEALYGTDPHNPDTFHLGMTDGEAVARGLIVPKAASSFNNATSTSTSTSPLSAYAPKPGTLTAAFAQNFLALYANALQSNGGTTLSQSDLSAIASQAVSNLTSSIQAAPNFKQMSDLKIIPSSSTALMDFASRAGTIMLKNTTTATSSEMYYMQLAVKEGDVSTSTAERLHSLAKAYSNTATGIASLPVPQDLAVTDLQIVNAIARLGQVVNDFANTDQDPLAAILALKEYPDTMKALDQAFTDIANTYSGVSLIPNTPAFFFATMVSPSQSTQ